MQNPLLPITSHRVGPLPTDPGALFLFFNYLFNGFMRYRVSPLFLHVLFVLVCSQVRPLTAATYTITVSSAYNGVSPGTTLTTPTLYDLDSTYSPVLGYSGTVLSGQTGGPYTAAVPDSAWTTDGGHHYKLRMQSGGNFFYSNETYVGPSPVGSMTLGPYTFGTGTCDGLFRIEPDSFSIVADEVSETTLKLIVPANYITPASITWSFEGPSYGCSLAPGANYTARLISGPFGGTVIVKATLGSQTAFCGSPTAIQPIRLTECESCTMAQCFLPMAKVKSLDVRIPFGPGKFGEGFAGALRLKVPDAPSLNTGDPDTFAEVFEIKIPNTQQGPNVVEKVTLANNAGYQYKAANMLCWVEPITGGSRVTLYPLSQVTGTVAPYGLVATPYRDHQLTLTRQLTGGVVTGLTVVDSVSSESGAPSYTYSYAYNGAANKWTVSNPGGFGDESVTKIVTGSGDFAITEEQRKTSTAGASDTIDYESTKYQVQPPSVQASEQRARQPISIQEGADGDSHTVTTIASYSGSSWQTGGGMTVTWQTKGGSSPTPTTFKKEHFFDNRLDYELLPWGNVQDKLRANHYMEFASDSAVKRTESTYIGGVATASEAPLFGHRSLSRPATVGVWYVEEIGAATLPPSTTTPVVSYSPARWVRRDDTMDRTLEVRERDGNVSLTTYASGTTYQVPNSGPQLPELVITTKRGLLPLASLSDTACPDANTCAQWLEQEVVELDTTGHLLRLIQSRLIGGQWVESFRREAITYDAVQQRPTTYSNTGGTQDQTIGCCNTVTTVSTDQVSTTDEMDWAGRLKRRTNSRNVETTFEYDPAGRFKKSSRRDLANVNAQSVQFQAASYASQGHAETDTNPLSGGTVTDEVVNSSGQLVRTITYPHGGIRRETYYVDGRLYELFQEGGRSVRYDYSFEWDQLFLGAWRGEIRFVTTETVLTQDAQSNWVPSSEWTKHYYDRWGNEVRTVRPAADGGPFTAVHTRAFDARGRLAIEMDPDLVQTVYHYDIYGNLQDRAILSGTTPSPDSEGVYPIDANNDRIERTETAYVTADTTAPMNMTSAGRQVKRYIYLPGQSSPTLTEQIDTSFNGLEVWHVVYTSPTQYALTKRVTSITGNGATRTTTTTYPDSSTLIETVINGQLITVQRLDANALQISKQDYSYTSDPYRRLYSVTDARNGTTSFSYNNADLVENVNSPAADTQTPAQTVSHFYDSSLREEFVFYPDSIRIYTYVKAQLQNVDGGGSYSTKYTYDYQGRLSTLQTFQDATPSITTFGYHTGRNLLTERQFPDPATGAKPSTDVQNIKYEYTQGGRIKKRRSPPDSVGTRIDTLYHYGFEGFPIGAPLFDDVTQIDYATPGNAQFTLDRAGRGPATVIFDGVTTTIGYDLQGAVTGETYAGGTLAGLSIDQSRDSLLRKSVFNAKNGATILASATFGYDAASRVKSVSDGTYWARYTYDGSSSLVNNIDYGKGNGPSLYTAMTWDKLNRLVHIQTQEYGRLTPLQSRDFTYTVADRIQTSTLEDGEKWTYAYNVDLGHLNSAHKAWPASGTPPQVAGQQFEYVYDNAGNRTKVRYGVDGGGADIYPATAQYNRQNQMVQRDVPGAIEVLGFADFNSTLTIKKDSVSTGAAERYNDYFRQRVSVANSSSALWTDINVQADSVVTSGKVFTPKTPEVFDDTATTTVNEGYDAEGNLKRDGGWNYTWDAQNRLTSMKSRDVVTGQQSRMVRIDFGYDWRGRRISKKVYPYLSGTGDNWTASSTPTVQRKFLYDGWNLITELDGANNSIIRSYLWGLDMAGQKGGGYSDAGGTGGLVAVRSGAEAHFYMQDGLGNISLTYDTVHQTESSRYEYGPFGEILRASGSWTANNPFRYSSKYCDTESNLSYFGYRYYDSSLARWLSRDPLGETGGPNLFAFTKNNPIRFVDALGLAPAPQITGFTVGPKGIEIRYNQNDLAYAGQEAFLVEKASIHAFAERVQPFSQSDFELDYVKRSEGVIFKPQAETGYLKSSYGALGLSSDKPAAVLLDPFWWQNPKWAPDDGHLLLDDDAFTIASFLVPNLLGTRSAIACRLPKQMPKYTKAYLDANYPRFKYAKWWRDELWDRALDSETGLVYDVSGKPIDPGVPWEVGHHGMTFAERQRWAAEKALSHEDWYDMEHNFSNFRPELPTSNASHIYEKWMQPSKY